MTTPMVSIVDPPTSLSQPCDLVASDECSPSEDEEDVDGIWTEFHDALETTLTQNLSTQTISDAKAKDLIETFNRRRSSLLPLRRSTPSVSIA